jgi:hypothetical protein
LTRKPRNITQGKLDLPDVPAPETRAPQALEPDTEPVATEALPDMADGGEGGDETDGGEVEQAPELTRAHLRGLLEALVFASDKPVT